MEESNTLFLYIIMAIVVPLLSRFIPHESFNNENNEGIYKYYLCSFIPIIVYTIFWGLRLDVGTDYGRYVKRFDNVDLFFHYKSGGELAFSYLCKGLSKLGFTSVSLFVVTSAINITSFFIIGRKYDRGIIQLIVFFFFVTSSVFFAQNGIRQAMATSLLIIYLSVDNDNKFKNFVIWLILTSIAMQTHRSSFILSVTLLCLNFIKTIEVKPYIVAIIYLGLELGGRHFQLSFLENSLGVIAAFGYEDQLVRVYEKIGEGATYSSGLGIPLRISLNMIVLYAFSLVNIKEEPKKTYLAYIVFSLGIFLDRIFAGSIILHRLAVLYTYPSCIAIGIAASILLRDKSRNINYYLGVALIVGYFMKYITGILANSNGVVPYNMVQF